MYDLEDIRSKIVYGTLLRAPSYNNMDPRLQKALKNVLRYGNKSRIEQNLKLLTDKELAFMRMMDDDEFISQLCQEELQLRHKLKEMLGRVKQIITEIHNHAGLKPQIYIEKIAQELDEELRVVSYIDELLHKEYHGFDPIMAKDAVEKMRYIVTTYPDYSLLKFLTHLESTYSPITMILVEVKDLEMDSPIKLSALILGKEKMDEIEDFVEKNRSLSYEDLSYLLTSIYQLSENVIYTILSSHKNGCELT